jgi:hypothetical protein
VLITILKKLRVWYWRARYRPGRTLTRFIACDVRRDVQVIDTSGINRGVIIARTCTWNVLYEHRGLVPRPAFGETRELAIRDLWNWDGERWGGQVPKSADHPSPNVQD